MNRRRAYEEVTIAHGDHAVTLRPSLRAATILEERYGLPGLFRALDDLNLAIISDIILVSFSSGDQNAAAFLSSLRGRPLSPFFASVHDPLAELVSMLIPAPDPKEKHKQTTGKPVTWAEMFATLYERATGWLGWTPEQAWNATPTEIDRAYRAHLEKLKALNGGTDDKEADSEQAERNIASGLDPEFDRAGLHALMGVEKKS